MRLHLDLSITADRLAGRVRGSDVVFDEPNVVALAPNSAIVAIGHEAHESNDASLLPGYAPADFYPQLTASVVYFIALRLWDWRRPQFKGFISALDRVDVRAEFERWDEIGPEARRAFLAALRYHHQLRWWINGTEVRY